MEEEIKKLIPDITPEQLSSLLELINGLRVKSETLGRINGLNQVRIAFWGIGYDNDDTANRVRQITTKEIMRLREPFDIEKSLNKESWFE